MTEASEVAFLAKVEKVDGGCWLWRGPMSRETCQFHHDGRTITARRYAYEHWVGPLPPRRHILVECGEALCVNPDHLASSSPRERFWRYVKKSEGCWEWTGTITVYGYGQFHVGKGRGKVPAHRYSLELHESVVPDELLVLHHCDNKPCVRPDHLYVGTHEDNARDACERGLMPAGERHWNSKLTDAQRGEIRERFEDGERNGDLAAEFGVAPSTITRITGAGAYAEDAA